LTLWWNTSSSQALIDFEVLTVLLNKARQGWVQIGISQEHGPGCRMLETNSRLVAVNARDESFRGIGHWSAASSL